MDAITGFAKLWEEGTKGRRFFIFGGQKDEEPLKRKVIRARYMIRRQIDKIEYIIEKLKARDEQLFTKLVDAIINNDMLRAKMLASEIAEIRKLAKALIKTQIALERVEYRLELFETAGDVSVALAPVVAVMGVLKQSMMKMVPELGVELSKIYEDLSEIVDGSEFYGLASGDVALTPEARKILKEAEAAAEQQVKQEFPNINLANGNKI